MAGAVRSATAEITVVGPDSPDWPLVEAPEVRILDLATVLAELVVRLGELNPSQPVKAVQIRSMGLCLHVQWHFNVPSARKDA